MLAQRAGQRRLRRLRGLGTELRMRLVHSSGSERHRLAHRDVGQLFGRLGHRGLRSNSHGERGRSPIA
jgi:hypothetical protein